MLEGIIHRTRSPGAHSTGKKGKIPCVLLAYFDCGVILRTLEGLVNLKDRLDVLLIENASPNSECMRQAMMRFVECGLISEYVFFKENISNNALNIILRNEISCADHEFVIVSDGDLVSEGDAWLEESLDVMRLHQDVLCIGGSLDMSNLPLCTFPKAERWIPPDIADRGEYIHHVNCKNCY